MIGARVVFIIVNAREYFIEKPFVEVPQLGFKIPAVLAIWQVVWFLWCCIRWFRCICDLRKKHKLPMLKMADIVILLCR